MRFLKSNNIRDTEDIMRRSNINLFEIAEEGRGRMDRTMAENFPEHIRIHKFKKLS